MIDTNGYLCECDTYKLFLILLKSRKYEYIGDVDRYYYENFEKLLEFPFDQNFNEP